MRTILTSLTLAVVALLTLAGTTQAAGKPGPSNGRGIRSDYDRHHDHDRRRDFDYVFRFGTRFDYGYFYSGRDHRHWTYSCYWPDYGCDCYYCPYSVTWYYWYAPRACYYPVSYIRYASPVRVAGPVGPVAVTPMAVAPVDGAAPAPPGR
jgi:hypothetical protein